MNGINDAGIRNLVSIQLRDMRKKIPKSDMRTFTLRDLDDIFRKSRVVSKQCCAEIQEKLKQPISLANLIIASCYCLALALHDSGKDDNLFPSDWLASKSSPNPNIILQALVSQLTNFSIAIVNLVEQGLDNQARSLVRTVIELSWQIIIISTYKKDFIEYAKLDVDDSDEATQAWFKLFGHGRMYKKLIEIDKLLGFNEEMTIKNKELREMLYSFFSQSIHHSKFAVFEGSWPLNLKKEKRIFSILGAASHSSHLTIGYLNIALWYFHRLFYCIIFNLHRLKPNPIEDWMEAWYLSQCVEEAFFNQEPKYYEILSKEFV